MCGAITIQGYGSCFTEQVHCWARHLKALQVWWHCHATWMLLSKEAEEEQKEGKKKGKHTACNTPLQYALSSARCGSSLSISLRNALPPPDTSEMNVHVCIKNTHAARIYANPWLNLREHLPAWPQGRVTAGTTQAWVPWPVQVFLPRSFSFFFLRGTNAHLFTGNYVYMYIKTILGNSVWSRETSLNTEKWLNERIHSCLSTPQNSSTLHSTSVLQVYHQSSAKDKQEKKKGNAYENNAYTTLHKWNGISHRAWWFVFLLFFTLYLLSLLCLHISLRTSPC